MVYHCFLKRVTEEEVISQSDDSSADLRVSFWLMHCEAALSAMTCAISRGRELMNPLKVFGEVADITYADVRRDERVLFAPGVAIPSPRIVQQA